MVNRSQTSATGILSITSEVPFELYNDNVKWSPFQVEGNRYDFVCGSQGNFLIKINGELVFLWKNEYEPDFDIGNVTYFQKGVDSESTQIIKGATGTYLQWKFVYEDLNTGNSFIRITPTTISRDLEITSSDGTWEWRTGGQDFLVVSTSSYDTSKPTYVFIGNVLVLFLEPYEG